MKIPLLRGRFFDSRDSGDSAPVILDQRDHGAALLAQPGASGQAADLWESGCGGGVQWYTIVGVVADTQRAGVDQPVFTESYGPLSQGPSRSHGDCDSLAGRQRAARAALAAAVRELDSQLPIAGFSGMDAALGTLVRHRDDSPRF